MKFKNPENGYIESRSAPWLWAFLFSGLYLMAVGAWRVFFVLLFIAIGSYAAMGPSATMLMVLANLILSAMAGEIVRSVYMRKGWMDLSVDSGQSSTGAAIDIPSGLRKCPYCAEEIKIEAIKCKHCGSTVEAIEESERTVVQDEEQKYMMKHGVHKSDEGYWWDGRLFPNIEAVKSAIGIY